MADRVHAFDVTIPAGTAKASPATTALSMLEGRVVRMALTFPDGCVGLVGIGVHYAHTQVIPFDVNTWLLANGVRLQFDLHNYPTGNQWALIGYNTDVYDHTIYVEFEVNEFGTGEIAAITFLPVEAIS
jgi:hypothetical protein